jgi:hypothetical protein
MDFQPPAKFLLHPDKNLLTKLNSKVIIPIHSSGFSVYSRRDFFTNTTRLSKYVVVRVENALENLFQVDISDASSNLTAYLNECKNDNLEAVETPNGIIMVSLNEENLVKVPGNRDENLFIAQINLWQFGVYYFLIQVDFRASMESHI